MIILDIRSIQLVDKVLFQIRLDAETGPQNVQLQPAQLWSYGVFRKTVREQTGEDYECCHLDKATASTERNKLWRDYIQALLEGGIKAEMAHKREKTARRGKRETQEMAAYVEVPAPGNLATKATSRSK